MLLHFTLLTLVLRDTPQIDIGRAFRFGRNATIHCVSVSNAHCVGNALCSISATTTCTRACSTPAHRSHDDATYRGTAAVLSRVLDLDPDLFE